MKKIKLKQVVAVGQAAVVGGLMLTPVLMSEANAALGCQPFKGKPQKCIANGSGNHVAGSCQYTESNGNVLPGGTGASCITPEMSDYLAMSFVMMAGGMIYHFRRRKVEALATVPVKSAKGPLPNPRRT